MTSVVEELFFVDCLSILPSCVPKKRIVANTVTPYVMSEECQLCDEESALVHTPTSYVSGSDFLTSSITCHRLFC